MSDLVALYIFLSVLSFIFVIIHKPFAKYAFYIIFSPVIIPLSLLIGIYTFVSSRMENRNIIKEKMNDYFQTENSSQSFVYVSEPQMAFITGLIAQLKSKNPRHYAKKNGKFHPESFHSLIIIGPHGVGKTSIANYIINNSRLPYFENAKNKEFSYFFIDDIDFCYRDFSDSDNKTKLDNLNKCLNSQKVFVIATATDENLIPEHIKSKFFYKQIIGKINSDTRFEILGEYFKSNPKISKSDLDWLAEILEDLTPVQVRSFSAALSSMLDNKYKQIVYVFN